MFTYYLRSKREEDKKIFKHQEGLWRKLCFCIQLRFLQKKKSILSLLISKLNLLTIKENCEEKTSGSQSFQVKSFISLETIPFSGSYFVQLKLFFLMKAILFTEKYLLQWKPLLLREDVAFSGSRSFQGKPLFQWKPSLLLEAFPLSESHSL